MAKKDPVRNIEDLAKGTLPEISGTLRGLGMILPYIATFMASDGAVFAVRVLPTGYLNILAKHEPRNTGVSFPVAVIMVDAQNKIATARVHPSGGSLVEMTVEVQPFADDGES